MADSKNTTVYHPSFADVSQVIPTADVEAWVNAGWVWLETPPKK